MQRFIVNDLRTLDGNGFFLRIIDTYYGSHERYKHFASALIYTHYIFIFNERNKKFFKRIKKKL